jgi:hypothetical protein
VRLPENAVIILEGIHALNPRLTAEIDDSCKFRIYIEPLTQLVVFAQSCLPPADARLLRRLVRDNQFRQMSPLDTFHIWPKVLEGEKKWIFPFASNADAVFDSGLEYELSVLKRYVAGLLEKVKARFGDRLICAVSRPQYIECTSPEAGKERALRELCRQLNIPRKSFYRYFPTKEDCLLALVTILWQTATILLWADGMEPQR